MQENLKILIIGAGGGREHAIGWKIDQGAQAPKLFFARGNAGTEKLGTNLDIKETEIAKLLEFAESEKINLVLVVSDDPLALGAVDEFQNAGFRVWGPTKAASELEWSKAYAKDFMKRHNVPTAKYQTFHDFEQAKIYLEKHALPVVVKASGLALGKGVTVAYTMEQAMNALEDILLNKIFGDAGNEVVIEEFLVGTEISIHALSDGKNWKIFPSSQDHKRAFDGDAGPNTGGVGVIAPLPFVDAEMMGRIESTIIKPIIEGMAKEGRPFIGCLYPGIMLTQEGPKVFEINSRFGDPETQVYMRLLETDFLDIVEYSLQEKIHELPIRFKNLSACNIALASGGYPGKYEKGKEITGIENAEKIKDVVVFHAGTKIEGDKLVSNGGRVLGVSVVGENLKEVLHTAYQAINEIKFEGMQYRTDIGQSALAALEIKS